MEKVSKLRVMSLLGNKLMMDLVIDLKPELSLKRPHEITSEIEGRVWERFSGSDIVIRAKPSKKPSLSTVRRIREITLSYPEVKNIHSIRVHEIGVNCSSYFISSLNLI